MGNDCLYIGSAVDWLTMADAADLMACLRNTNNKKNVCSPWSLGDPFPGPKIKLN